MASRVSLWLAQNTTCARDTPLWETPHQPCLQCLPNEEAHLNKQTNKQANKKKTNKRTKHDSKSTNRYSLLQAVHCVLCRPYLNHLGKRYDILMIIYPGLLLKKFPHCYSHTYQIFRYNQEAEIGVAATHNICTGSRINLYYRIAGYFHGWKFS